MVCHEYRAGEPLDLGGTSASINARRLVHSLSVLIEMPVNRETRALGAYSTGARQKGYHTRSEAQPQPMLAHV